MAKKKKAAKKAAKVVKVARKVTVKKTKGKAVAKTRTQVVAKKKSGKKKATKKKRRASKPTSKKVETGLSPYATKAPVNLSEEEVTERLIAAGFILGRNLCGTYIEACKMAFFESPANGIPIELARAIKEYPKQFPNG